MDIALIVSILSIIVALIIGILGIIATLWPDKFKKAKQKSKNLFKVPSSLGKFIKYTIFFLIVGGFIYISIIQARKVEFNPQIYNVIGFWGFCFIIGITVIIAREQDIEKGDEELATTVKTLADMRSSR